MMFQIYRWIRNEVTVTSSLSWQLKFTSVVGRSYLSDVAIDDIEMTPGACGATEGSCDFEHDRCTWNNKGGRQSWVRSAPNLGSPQSPATDHTSLRRGSGKTGDLWLDRF